MSGLLPRFRRGMVPIIGVALVVFIVGRFWVGYYEDDEFNDQYLFIKHQPTWQFVFMPVLSSGAEQADVDRLPPAARVAHDRYMAFIYRERTEVYIPWSLF